MKRIILLACLISLNVLYGLSQTPGNGRIGMEGKLSNQGNYIRVGRVVQGFPADIAGLRVNDRIVRIDDRPVRDLSGWSDYVRGEPGTKVKLTVKRFGWKSDFDITVLRMLMDDNSIAEGDLFARILTNDYSNFDVGGMYDQTMSVLHDKERDLFKYKTYDFEYTSQSDPLLEKEILGILGKRLDRMGMRRIQDNPDLLVVITFFSGQKEQYVPPQQIISTKIKQSYNLYWGYIPVAVTETSTSPGYTDITYLDNIGLKFLDAKEIETSKVPPVVWSGSVSHTYKSKYLLIDKCDTYFSHMLEQFPETWFPDSERYFLSSYAYTGIIYNRSDFRAITGILPGSPAEKAGIRNGDIIVSINGYKLPENFAEAGPDKWKTMAYEGSKSGFRYLYLFANLKFKPYGKDTNSLQFKIKRNGKTMIFNVQPEQKQFYKLFKNK
jgi:hypothetical protein